MPSNRLYSGTSFAFSSQNLHLSSMLPIPPELKPSAVIFHIFPVYAFGHSATANSSSPEALR